MSFSLLFDIIFILFILLISDLTRGQYEGTKLLMNNEGEEGLAV